MLDVWEDAGAGINLSPESVDRRANVANYAGSVNKKENNMTIHKIQTPFDDETVMSLKAGDQVFISGYIHTARDAAHKRWCDVLNSDESFPFEFQGEVIYFAGPAPAKPGQSIGSIGPTTSYRMDDYSPLVIEKAGIKGMIGKGNRSQIVIEAMKKFKCVYFAASGGLGALLANSVVASEIIAYEDLGPEAVRRLTIKDFPAIVAIDCYGNNLYETGQARFLVD